MESRKIKGSSVKLDGITVSRVETTELWNRRSTLRFLLGFLNSLQLLDKKKSNTTFPII